MVYRLKKTVVMVGMMGAGKTAVGTAVARLLGVPFTDSDDAIVEAANMTIAEIFERDGEAFFRDKERQVIARLLEAPPQILSTGGGAFLSPENRSLINDGGAALWLRADLKLLWERVRHKTTRPLLRTENPHETLKALLEARDPFYALAPYVVDAQPGISIDEMAMKVINTLLQHPDLLEKDPA
ncbi:MAG: shikimate kinase [Pseudomonadota bacterium]